MDEEELRKSVRRQKFEKQGLTLPTSQSGTNTGTGTSDDEEDSTPSADLAERSLVTTLAESTEQLAPLQSQSSFLQAALDGPGGFPERNDRSMYTAFIFGFTMTLENNRNRSNKI